jgi:hypothetical protein
MDQLNEERAAGLAKELSELSNQQSETLRTAAYLPMSPKDWATYEKRRERISEICTLLSNYHPSRL